MSDEITKMYETEPERGLEDPPVDLSLISNKLDSVTASLNYMTNVLNALLVTMMRLYDVELAGLNRNDPTQADEIFETHLRGETFNPDIMIDDRA